MSRRMIEVVVDDLTGETIEEGQAETVRFAIGSTAYQMDLGKASAERFHAALAPFVAAATKVGRQAPVAASSPKRNSKADLAAIRAWAADNGHHLSGRGRIPQSVIDAYRAAH